MWRLWVEADIVADPDGGSLAFSYDGSLPTSIAWAGQVAGSVGFAFNANFEPTARTLNSGGALAFDYNLDGQLTSAGSLVLSYATATGFLTGSSVGSTTGALAYTSYGELDSFGGNFGASPLYSFDLDRDASGRIVAKTETIEGTTSVWEYRYDTAERLDEVKRDGNVVANYGYDSNSNRTSWTDFWGSGAATYDAQDRLLTSGPRSYSYTANGELLTKAAGPETTTYDYDVFGNLRTVDLPTRVEIEYLIDAANRRIGKRVNGTLVQGFLWQSQLQPAAELDGAGAIVAEFVYGTKGNVPDYLVKGGVNYRLFTDHLGSVRLVVNAATGAVAQRLDYDAFGRILLDTNPGFQPFGFAGGLYDLQTGLTRFGARDYDAETGRWIGKDPIGFAGGDINLYGYVLNDPINLIDPPGLWAGVDDLAFAAGGALVGLLGQGVGDLISGESSSWQDYVGSAVGGAAGGWALLYTGPVGAGAVGGAVTNLSKQGLNWATGKQCGLDASMLVVDTGIGALTGFIPGVHIPHLSAGSNSYNAIYRQMARKLSNGTASRVRPQTAAKMFAGRAAETGLLPGTGAAAVAGIGASKLLSGGDCGCN